MSNFDDASAQMLDPKTPQKNIRFGTAIRPDQLAGEGPLLTAIRRCELLVPEYHGQWSAVEWDRGSPWFGNYDAITDFAANHNQTVRGHSLIWENMTPEWARREMAEQQDWRLIERHFGNLLERYRGRIGEWVVVNEMIDTEDGDKNFRRTSFQRAFGNEYVARALSTAASFDPGAKLMINEYALCHDNPVDERRRIALLKLVEDLKKRDVPLHMVGIQGHIELSKGMLPQRRLEQFLSELAGMGVELALTEVDVLEDDRSLTLAQRDLKVAQALDQLLTVASAEPAVTSITTWGLSDRYSWLQERSTATLSALEQSPLNDEMLNRGLPFDSAMRPKEMFGKLTRQLPSSRISTLT